MAEQPLGSRLQDIVGQTAKETDASYALLLLCAYGTSELRNAACYGRQEAPPGLLAVAEWVLRRAKPLVCQDNADVEGIAGCGLTRSSLPAICVPVTGTTSRGVLAVGFALAAGQRLQLYLPFIRAQAELIGALLENEALQKYVRQKEEQVQNLVRETLDAQEAERERICLEVHDGVAQTMASAFQYLQTLETVLMEDAQARQLLLRARALVKQAIQESREVINSLQPSALIDLGLVATLRQEMRQLEQETGWGVDFEADTIRLPKNVETGLYRIIHEAIANAKKHSQTKRLHVSIASVDGRLKVEVRDWGVGFYLPPVDRRRVLRRRGTGLLSMRKRAELLQGVCDVQTSLGQGTTVSLEIPIGGNAE